MHGNFSSGRLKPGGILCTVKPKYTQWQPSDICLYIYLLRIQTPLEGKDLGYLQPVSEFFSI